MERAMEKLAVIHTAFDDKPSTVAFVDVPEFPTLIEKLEYAYRWTNNVMGSWSRKQEVFEDGSANGDLNDRVVVKAPLHDGMGLRSTSMGDMMHVDGRSFEVAMMGFQELV